MGGQACVCWSFQTFYLCSQIIPGREFASTCMRYRVFESGFITASQVNSELLCTADDYSTVGLPIYAHAPVQFVICGPPNSTMRKGPDNPCGEEATWNHLPATMVSAESFNQFKVDSVCWHVTLVRPWILFAHTQSTDHQKSGTVNSVKILHLYQGIQRGNRVSFFDPCVNAIGRQPYWLSHMEVSYCTFGFDVRIRCDLRTLSLPCDSPRHNLYACVF